MHTRYLNRAEAAAVERVVTKFLKSGVRADQIGVITPYEGQRAFVLTHMAKAGTLRAALYKDIEVASVDSFQVRHATREGGRVGVLCFVCVRAPLCVPVCVSE